VGDLVLARIKGRSVYGEVLEITDGQVNFRPLCPAAGWRHATAREIMGHWRKTGRRAAGAELARRSRRARRASSSRCPGAHVSRATSTRDTSPGHRSAYHAGRALGLVIEAPGRRQVESCVRCAEPLTDRSTVEVLVDGRHVAGLALALRRAGDVPQHIHAQRAPCAQLPAALGVGDRTQCRAGDDRGTRGLGHTSLRRLLGG
jgi:hypothetical protein